MRSIATDVYKKIEHPLSLWSLLNMRSTAAASVERLASELGLEERDCNDDVITRRIDALKAEIKSTWGGQAQRVLVYKVQQLKKLLQYIQQVKHSDAEIMHERLETVVSLPVSHDDGVSHAAALIATAFMVPEMKFFPAAVEFLHKTSLLSAVEMVRDSSYRMCSMLNESEMDEAIRRAYIDVYKVKGIGTDIGGYERVYAAVYANVSQAYKQNLRQYVEERIWGIQSIVAANLSGLYHDYECGKFSIDDHVAADIWRSIAPAVESVVNTYEPSDWWTKESAKSFVDTEHKREERAALCGFKMRR